MDGLDWKSESDFEIGGYTIRLSYVHGGSEAKSSGNEFALMKGKKFLQHYTSLDRMKCRKVLELGVYQGGSFVFLDQLLQPEKISAVELSTTPISALDEYVSKHSSRAKLHYGTSQDDTDRLLEIVREDFGGELDLVVDDASHFYEQTKTSFKTLFPLLRPGGTYIIEDWNWAFQDVFQSPDNDWFSVPSPANLMIDLLEDMTRNGMISGIEVYRQLWKIHRSEFKADGVFLSQGRRGRTIGVL
ncbi:class I SAM-dependent methyltransferase [Paraburkholderia bannensis]|uniref:class I SAM-dependent methyltransferase n=1 Tax=Paraburkholderia bannensis TaxID=765414 RepID=UPI002AB2672A|nr:class I SAM-dependent methyltransferase [Paraburkholderia bannensis]